MALSATLTVMGGRPVARTALWALLSLSGVGAWMAPAAVPRLSPRARCVSARAASKNLPVRATAAAAAAGGSRPLRILCADKLDEAALESLRKKGHEVLSQPELSATTLEAALAELAPQLLVVRSTKVLAPALAAAPGLELVVRAGAGVDNIDLAAAASQGVSVANCAGANAAAVAELALGLMIACDRRIVEQDNRLKKGAWAKGVFGDGRSRGLRGRVLGIVGFGRIGREVSALGQAFGMRVVAWSRSPITQPPEGIEVVPTLAELAVCSDVVSVHTAPSPDGPLLDAAFFNAMNMGSIFINVARGGVVDEEALLNAIEVRALRVGTDVFEGEPSGGEAAFDSPLAQHPSVVATHHVGAATVQAQEAVAEVLVQIIDVYSTSAQVMNAVAV